MKINISEDSRTKKDGVLRGIVSYIVNKDILDIGCVEHSLKNKNKDRIWVHDFLRDYGNNVTGIDILKNDIETLREKGYDVYEKNAENFVLQKKFDVIFAGEIIEHLSNPGLFLNQCYEHLNDNGVLIITTPNCFSFFRLACIIRRFTNNPDVNLQHTCWFSPTVIKELLSRAYFKINKIVYVNYPYIRPNIYIKIVN
jgi:2-polyprenyl-3-methyl-5-hydroxy-6-metoxy-1,4-benzoquinol methylase